MDPNATLKLALDAIASNDHDAAAEALSNLKTWIDSGGFAPAPDPATFRRILLDLICLVGWQSGRFNQNA